MPHKIQAAFQRLVADGQIDKADAKTLINTAKDWRIVTDAEKQKLKTLLEAHGDKFSHEAKVDLHGFLGLPPPVVTPPPPSGDAINLGTNPAGESVFLKDGFFVTDAAAPLPTTPLAIGNACYDIASLIAASDPEQNLFGALTFAQKQALFENLESALRQVPPDVEIPSGYETALQAKQQRASVATAMLELMRSANTDAPQERLLQDSILKTYAHAAKHETSATLRDSMVFQLHLNKDRLVTPAQREISNELMRLFAPTTPPYDEWFKGGNDTLNVVCHTGSEFYTSEIDRWKGEGFEPVDDARSGRTVLEKTFERNGVTTKVRLTMMRGSSGTFDDMDDANTHIVAYSGHASWGRTIPQALRNAPEQQGAKVVLIHQCCGRGTINKFRDSYAESQLVTTRNSSYETEDFNTFFTTLEGIAERRSWASISNTIRDDRWNNRRDNYYFPNDVLLRMRARDRDHDGIADVVDRMVNFNAFKVAEETSGEFQAKDPGRAVDELEGSKVHEAAQIMNTTTTFSDFMEVHGTGESFLGAGYFAPQGADEPMVKIATTDAGGQKSYEVQVNAHFAHASEEAIKAEAFFTVAHTPPFKRDGDSALETCLKGLILVGHSLDVDGGYRDGDIFSAFLTRHKLPAIDVSTVKACVDLNHVYAGSAASITKLREKLGPDKLAEIEAALA